MRTQNVSIILEDLEEFRPKSELSSLPMWWQFDGVAFPDVWWFDNPAIVLPWWVAQLTVLTQGAKTVGLRVMEGPYTLTLRPAGGDHVELRPRSGRRRELRP